MHHDTSLPPLPANACFDAAQRRALDGAMRFLALVQTWGQPAAMTQALTQVGQCLMQATALDMAEAYFARALQWSATLGAVDAQVDLLCTLAELHTRLARQAYADDLDESKGNACRERARDHAFDAAALAGQVTDPQWEVRVLLRISDVLEHCGDHAEAVTFEDRAAVLLGLEEPDFAPDFRDLPALTAPAQLM